MLVVLAVLAQTRIPLPALAQSCPPDEFDCGQAGACLGDPGRFELVGSSPDCCSCARCALGTIRARQDGNGGYLPPANCEKCRWGSVCGAPDEEPKLPDPGLCTFWREQDTHDTYNLLRDLGEVSTSSGYPGVDVFDFDDNPSETWDTLATNFLQEASLGLLIGMRTDMASCATASFTSGVQSMSKALDVTMGVRAHSYISVVLFNNGNLDAVFSYTAPLGVSLYDEALTELPTGVSQRHLVRGTFQEGQRTVFVGIDAPSLFPAPQAGTNRTITLTIKPQQFWSQLFVDSGAVTTLPELSLTISITFQPVLLLIQPAELVVALTSGTSTSRVITVYNVDSQPLLVNTSTITFLSPTTTPWLHVTNPPGSPDLLNFSCAHESPSLLDFSRDLTFHVDASQLPAASYGAVVDIRDAAVSVSLKVTPSHANMSRSTWAITSPLSQDDYSTDTVNVAITLRDFLGTPTTLFNDSSLAPGDVTFNVTLLAADVVMAWKLATFSVASSTWTASLKAPHNGTFVVAVPVVGIPPPATSVYLGPVQCTAFDPNSFVTGKGTTCSCRSGYEAALATPNGKLVKCTPCPAGTTIQGDEATCLPCDAFTVATGPGSATCSPCPKGSAPNTARTTCVPCEPGLWAQPGAAQCEACPVGLYPTEDQAACRACTGNAGFNTFTNVSRFLVVTNGSVLDPAEPSLASIPVLAKCETCPSNNQALTSGVCSPCDSSKVLRKVATRIHNRTLTTITAEWVLRCVCRPSFYTNTAAARNTTEEFCVPCPEGAFCAFKTQSNLLPLAGFSQVAWSTLEFTKCRGADACPGVELDPARLGEGDAYYVSQEVKFLEKSAAQVNTPTNTEMLACSNAFPCSTGFTGPLCYKCATHYTRVGTAGCETCIASGALVFCILLGIFIAVGFTVFLVRRAVVVHHAKHDAAVAAAATSTPDTPLPPHPSPAPTSMSREIVALKILVSHLQEVSVSVAFKLTWPTWVLTMFDVFAVLSSAGQTLFSLSCLLEDATNAEADLAGATCGLTRTNVTDNVYNLGVVDPAKPLTFFSEAIFLASVPVAWALVSGVFWALFWWRASKLGKRRGRSAFNYWLLTQMVLLFLLYPTLSRTSLRFFSCSSEDLSGVRFMETDFNVVCFGPLHTRWLGLGVIMLLVYPIGVPAITFAVLVHHHKNLTRYRGIFAFVFEGFRSPYYYWEVVIMVRKLCFSICAVLLGPLGADLQALAGMMVIVVFIQFQATVGPYDDPLMNRIELGGLMVRFFTLALGLMLDSPHASWTASNTFGAFIVLCNAAYLLVGARIVVQTLLRMRKDGFFRALGMDAWMDDAGAGTSFRSLVLPITTWQSSRRRRQGEG